jgi:hypothetical protein
MDLADISQEGNEKAIKLCKEFLEKLGPSPGYVCGVASAASALLFHLYRLGREHGDSIPRLQALLDDVADNVTKTEGGQKVLFTVEPPFEGRIPYGHYPKIDDLQKAYDEKREFKLTNNIRFPIESLEVEKVSKIAHFLGRYRGGRVAGICYASEEGPVAIQMTE